MDGWSQSICLKLAPIGQPLSEWSRSRVQSLSYGWMDGWVDSPGQNRTGMDMWPNSRIRVFLIHGAWRRKHIHPISFTCIEPCVCMIRGYALCLVPAGCIYPHRPRGPASFGECLKFTGGKQWRLVHSLAVRTIGRTPNSPYISVESK